MRENVGKNIFPELEHNIFVKFEVKENKFHLV